MTLALPIAFLDTMTTDVDADEAEYARIKDQWQRRLVQAREAEAREADGCFADASIDDAIIEAEALSLDAADALVRLPHVARSNV